jgi:hypothetical protein
MNLPEPSLAARHPKRCRWHVRDRCCCPASGRRRPSGEEATQNSHGISGCRVLRQARASEQRAWLQRATAKAIVRDLRHHDGRATTGPIASSARSPPFGLLGMRRTFCQRPDQSQECLVLWSVPILAEERSNLDVRGSSAGSLIRMVRDKDLVGIVVADEKPAITVGAMIQLSHMMSHSFPHSMLAAKLIGPLEQSDSRSDRRSK